MCADSPRDFVKRHQESLGLGCGQVMPLLLVRGPHVRSIGWTRETPKSSGFNHRTEWLAAPSLAVRCRGCLPEFLHLLSVSLICMAWDSSFPQAHPIQWEQVQRCAEDTPLFFKGRTLMSVPQPCSLPTSQSLITPIWRLWLVLFIWNVMSSSATWAFCD